MSPGSRDAQIEALVRQYGRLIRQVVKRVGGQAAAPVCDDIEQEVVIALWRLLEREQTINYPGSYIYRAAVRETVRAVRREISQRQLPLDEAAERIAAPVSNEPDAILELRLHSACVRAAIQRLPDDRGRAVRAHLAGFRVAEIMEMYGWTYQRARNLIARGIADLRRTLKDEGVDGQS
jgi:RNA polymerase sigma factor (sigma-70 family)